MALPARMSLSPVRMLAVLCPRWAPTAAGLSPQVPSATFHANRVVVASRAAEAWGIRRGLRRREAQARCPDLEVLDHDEVRDVRAFEPVIQAVERFSPRVEVVRPGLCVLETRGPARFFGGERLLTLAIRDAVDELDLPAEQSTTGIAGGVFAAALAAQRNLIVPEGQTRDFLAPIGVGVLGTALSDLLVRLGIRTLGALAALPERDVVARFGAEGRWAHQLARGDEGRPHVPRQPPVELTVGRELDPPAQRVDVAMFVAKSLADELIGRLTELGLSCAKLRVELETEHGEERVRIWRYSAAFTSAAVAERVRWQLEGWLAAPAADAPTGGIALVRLVPEDVGPATGSQHGLWGRTADVSDTVRRSLDRVQGLLGHEGVLQPILSGGRGPSEQVHLVPWGDPVEPARPGLPGERWVRGPVTVELPPWPGRLPAPAPARIPPSPLPVEMVDGDGGPVGVSRRLEISAPPAQLRVGRSWRQVVAWAGPWPFDERWWDEGSARRRVRLQAALDDGSAVLLCMDESSWSVEAVYD